MRKQPASSRPRRIWSLDNNKVRNYSIFHWPEGAARCHYGWSRPDLQVKLREVATWTRYNILTRLVLSTINLRSCTITENEIGSQTQKSQGTGCWLTQCLLKTDCETDRSSAALKLTGARYVHRYWPLGWTRHAASLNTGPEGRWVTKARVTTSVHLYTSAHLWTVGHCTQLFLVYEFMLSLKLKSNLNTSPSPFGWTAGGSPLKQFF